MPLHMIDGFYQGDHLKEAKDIIRKKEKARQEFSSGMEGRSWCFLDDSEIARRKAKYDEAMWQIEIEQSELDRRIRVENKLTNKDE